MHFSESGRVAFAVAYCTVFLYTATTETLYWNGLLQTRCAQHMLTHLRQFHHASLQHDFAGKGKYNVLHGVSKNWY